MHWHTEEISGIVETLNSSVHGLSRENAERRLLEYGPNELKEKKKKTALMMFLEQFRDFLILVLIAAALISGFIGELSDTIAIIVIIVLIVAFR